MYVHNTINYTSIQKFKLHRDIMKNVLIIPRVYIENYYNN